MASRSLTMPAGPVNGFAAPEEDATRHRLDSALPFILALLAVAGVTFLSLPFRDDLDAVDLLVFYLVAITGVALVADLKASITAAVTAFLAFNFFFTDPHYTFFVANTHDILALAAMLGLSIIVSRLVVRARSRTREALRRGRQTETLYQLSFALIRANDLDAVLESIVDGVRRMFDVATCAVLLERDGSLQVGASTATPLNVSNPKYAAAAERSLARGEPVRVDTGSDGPEVQFIPISTSEHKLGLLLVARKRGLGPLDAEDVRLLVTFANQAALAIERSQLADERTRAEVLSRADELKSALLSAVSHDLRTPLASIKASITTMMQPGIEWSDAERHDLQEAIDEETNRLNRLVENLLDLSRIEAGALSPALDWYQPSEIVFDVIERCDAVLNGHRVSVELPAETLWIHVDFVMISQVLTNLLENAAKYSPPDSEIRVIARERSGHLEVRVEDEGTGVPAGEEQRIFDKFYRVEARYRPVGSGMGLAICRGFFEAHGGRIWVEPNAGGGSVFAFTLPLALIDPLAGRAHARTVAAS